MRARAILLTAFLLIAGPSTAIAQQVDTVGTRPANLVGLGPDGATLRCRDGSYPAPFSADSACEGKGGVLVRFRVRGDPPPPKMRARPAAVVGPTAASLGALQEAPTAAAIPARAIPEGATLLCRDGTLIVADTSSTRCAAHRGVKVRFSTRRDRPRS